MKGVLIIGGGFVGLMVVDMILVVGYFVVVVEVKFLVVCKFLMVGKLGLNLIKDELFEFFLKNFFEVVLYLCLVLEVFGL